MCREFCAGFARIDLDPRRMPRQAMLSTRLRDACGWTIETVPGLIPADEFFALLRERRFPSPDWIRHPDDLEYTPAPDLFHDVFGHLPQLCAPTISSAIEALAERARGTTPAELAEIERVYWFTIEFGLVREFGTQRALGAGLASSIAELTRALCDPGVERRAFTFESARRTTFDPTHPQPVYLVASSMPGLAAELDRRAQAG
jgi:phenylalanine-4-hydroxylase